MIDKWVYPWNEPLRSLVQSVPGAWDSLVELTGSKSFWNFGTFNNTGGWVKESDFKKAVKRDGQ